MKTNKYLAIALMIIATAVYRVAPFHAFGFAPQLAVAVFSGAMFAGNRKMAFLLPILSMLISDTLFQVLYTLHYTSISGFYGYDQIVNYLMIASLAIVGFTAQNFKLKNILTANISAPILFFLASNFFVWLTFGGYHHPQNFAGLMACYADGLPFFWNSLSSTVVFGGIFFGTTYYFAARQPKAIAM